MEGWDDHKVAKFIEGVGSGKAWARYAQKCVDDEIDGKTLCAADVDDLIRLGFSHMHAKAVISARDALLPPPQVPVLAAGLGVIVTEAELVELQRIGPHRELLANFKGQIASCLTNMPSLVAQHQTEVNKLVDSAITKWEQARKAALDRLAADQEQFQKQLEQALADITESQRVFETKASSADSLCSTPLRPSETQTLKQRQMQVAAMVRECVSSSFCSLVQGPSWSVVPDGKVLVDVRTSPCVLATVSATLPPVNFSVNPQYQSARVTWAEPENLLKPKKLEYVLQLARTSRAADAPPPYSDVPSYDEKEAQVDYHEVYRGSKLSFDILQLEQGEPCKVRLRVESEGTWGDWTVVSFSTKQSSPPGRQTFSQPGRFKFVVPAGVTAIDAILMGGGGCGGGSGLPEQMAGMRSAFGAVVAEGGGGGREMSGGAGGAGSFAYGGKGGQGERYCSSGGGAAGGADGKGGTRYQAGAGGSTALRYAGHGGNGRHHGQADPPLPTSGAGAIESAAPVKDNQSGHGAKYGGGGAGYGGGGGGGGGYSQVRNFAVVPGSTIEVEVGQGGMSENDSCGSGGDGLVVVGWGGCDL